MSHLDGNNTTINGNQSNNCYINTAMEDNHQSPPSYESVVQNFPSNAAYPSYSQPLPVVQPLPTAYRPLPYDNSNYNEVCNDIMPPKYNNTTSITSVVITNQPQIEYCSMTPPPDYTVAAWLVCLFCCWPFGLRAIFYANVSRSHLNSGNIVEARNASRRALHFIIASLLGGVIVMVFAGIRVYIQLSSS